MAGAACKVIINQMTQALSSALETILTDPNINGGLIPEEDRLNMIQALANNDLVSFAGPDSVTVNRGDEDASLLRIVLRLESYGLISPDVWVILPKPEVVISIDPGPGPAPVE